MEKNAKSLNFSILKVDKETREMDKNRCKEALSTHTDVLTLIWVALLGVFLSWEGGITPSPCLKLVRIMLETSNLVREYTHI